MAIRPAPTPPPHAHDEPRGGPPLLALAAWLLVCSLPWALPLLG